MNKIKNSANSVQVTKFNVLEIFYSLYRSLFGHSRKKKLQENIDISLLGKQNMASEN